MNTVRNAVAVSLLCGAVLMPVQAEDTELFVADLSDREGYRPKVLIIFDNSGSMASNVVSVPGEYDPTVTYDVVSSSDNSLNDDAIYYTVAGIDDAAPPVPGGPNEHRRFDGTNNACAESLKPLALTGRFTGYLREFRSNGRYRGTWQEVPSNDGLNTDILDCLEDMNKGNTLNPYGLGDYHGLDASGDPIIVSTRESSASSPFNVGSGYPYDSGNRSGPLYTDDYDSRSAYFHRSRPVTLYTANYLRWYHSVVAEESEQSRLAVAKEAAENLITSVPGVDFGLMIFNLNYPTEGLRDGGRIVRGIEQSSAESHQEVIDIINGLEGNTNTPLCETLYEAMRYFGGLSVQFGDDDSNENTINYHGNIPPMDTGIVDSSNIYISPFDECADIAYVILVTDGMPSKDTNADTAISLLDGVTEAQKVDYGSGMSSGSSYLAALANYMHDNDIYTGEANLEAYKAENQGREPKQTVTTYTIGFGDDATTSAGELLEETALRGGGLYFEASDSVGLESALYAALVDILLTDSSMTSPAIAANNFDRTRSLDNIYYSMFSPSTGPRWFGNIKKLKMAASGILVDKNGVPAIDENGNIKEDAVTFWDQSNDAIFEEEIAQDGVNAALTTGFASRTIYTVVDNALVSLNDITVDATFAAELGVDESGVPTMLNWIYGMDVDDDDGDGDATDARHDIFNDPYHSKPLVLNLSTDITSEDLRIVVGTNGGMLHFFRDNGESVAESWAFLPSEFVSNQLLLRENEEASDKLYGVDGSPMTYQYKGSTYLYFGLRRGGSAYYALDITSPDSPQLMWHIDSSTTGFSELGQSWGRPVVTNIPGYVDAEGNPKPVVVLSGGYDPNKDTLEVGTADSVGRGLFLVDAQTGTLIWSATPAASTTVNLQVAGFTDSMPAAPAVLDSNGDGLSDRIYLSDTGGNVWRFDLYSTTRSQWTVYKFAQLGGDAEESDRRFFYTPTIARTLERTVNAVVVDGDTTYEYGTRPFDAILIGSGDRTRPASSKTVQDYFFMLKDEYISVTNFGTGDSEVAYPEAIVISSLADITSDPVGSATSEVEILAAKTAISQANGWKYELTDDYEKAFGDAIVLEGTVFFTSFTPPGTADEGVCVQMGMGRVYAVNLQLGTNTFSWRSLDIGERVPDTLVVHSGVDENGNSTLRILGVGQGDEVGYDLNGDGVIGETETVNTGNLLSSASMAPKKVHTHEDLSR